MAFFIVLLDGDIELPNASVYTLLTSAGEWSKILASV